MSGSTKRTALAAGVLAAGAAVFGISGPASAEPGYVQEISGTFTNKTTSGTAHCSGKIELAQTDTNRIEAAGSLNCPGTYVTMKIDVRITAASNSVNWITRKTSTCSTTGCHNVFAATTTAGVHGKKFCAQAYGTDTSVLPATGFKAICFTAK